VVDFFDGDEIFGLDIRFVLSNLNMDDMEVFEECVYSFIWIMRLKIEQGFLFQIDGLE